MVQVNQAGSSGSGSKEEIPLPLPLDLDDPEDGGFDRHRPLHRLSQNSNKIYCRIQVCTSGYATRAGR